MRLSMLNEETQALIYNHKEANLFVSQHDSVSYDAVGDREFDVLAYDYDENGILDYVGSKRFTY